MLLQTQSAVERLHGSGAKNAGQRLMPTTMIIRRLSTLYGSAQGIMRRFIWGGSNYASRFERAAAPANYMAYLIRDVERLFPRLGIGIELGRLR